MKWHCLRGVNILSLLACIKQHPPWLNADGIMQPLILQIHWAQVLIRLIASWHPSTKDSPTWCTKQHLGPHQIKSSQSVTMARWKSSNLGFTITAKPQSFGEVELAKVKFVEASKYVTTSELFWPRPAVYCKYHLLWTSVGNTQATIFNLLPHIVPTKPKLFYLCVLCTLHGAMHSLNHSLSYLSLPRESLRFLYLHMNGTLRRIGNPTTQAINCSTTFSSTTPYSSVMPTRGSPSATHTYRWWPEEGLQCQGSFVVVVVVFFNSTVVDVRVRSTVSSALNSWCHGQRWRY